MSSTISIGLAAARQGAALGYGRPKPAPPPSSGPSPSAPPVTPAKPQGTGLLVDARA